MPIVHSRKHKVGLPPGALPRTPSPGPAALCHLIDFDLQSVRERDLSSVDEAIPFRDAPTTTWLDVQGNRDVPTIETLARAFGLHPIVVEDIATPGQRPRVERFPGYTYIVVRMLRFDRTRRRLDDEQVSILLGPSWVATVQERAGDVLDPLRRRIRQADSRVRSEGPAYLAYAIVDCILDHGFVVVEEFANWLDGLDGRVLDSPDRAMLEEIQGLRRQLLLLRRACWPMRDLASQLNRLGAPLDAPELQPFLRDLQDHAVRVLESAEMLHELANGLLELWLSVVGFRSNEVMRVLTIVATIFIPLTFIAGVYGMNFRWMPELEWKAGYPGVLLLMGAVAAGLLRTFRRRGWL